VLAVALALAVDFALPVVLAVGVLEAVGVVLGTDDGTGLTADAPEIP
jgi:hypothetical protein